MSAGMRQAWTMGSGQPARSLRATTAMTGSSPWSSTPLAALHSIRLELTPNRSATAGRR